MSNVTIRKAERSDIPEIQRLCRQLDRYHAELLPEIFQSLQGNAQGNEILLKWIECEDADYLLAELDDTVVGFLNVKRSAHPTFPVFRPHEFAMIESAVVDNPHRGKGIGTKLFDAAVVWARENGLRYVQTTVWDANTGAREFYVDQGFRPLTLRLELDTERDADEADI